MTCLKNFRLVIDMTELGIPIGMISPFVRLPIRLQTVVHLPQEVCNRARPHLMSHPVEFARQFVGTFARPPQW